MRVAFTCTAKILLVWAVFFSAKVTSAPMASEEDGTKDIICRAPTPPVHLAVGEVQRLVSRRQITLKGKVITLREAPDGLLQTLSSPVSFKEGVIQAGQIIFSYATPLGPISCTIERVGSP